jgi:YrbI family 3-deoxy-D-manno-octulosonate 8-phosphate phosphatase
VLTDGKYFYTEDGKYIVSYHCNDSIAINLAKKSGLTCIMVSSTTFPNIHMKRASDLGIEFISARPTGSKLSILSKRFDLNEAVYVGDTVDDILVLNMAKISFVPNNSFEEVKSHADYVLSKNSGEGCLLEVMFILRDKYGINIRY